MMSDLTTSKCLFVAPALHQLHLRPVRLNPVPSKTSKPTGLPEAIAVSPPKTLELGKRANDVTHVRVCQRIGTPSFTGGGLTTCSGLLGLFGLSIDGSSALVSRCRKLLSLTGLPLLPPATTAPFRLPLWTPFGTPFGPDEDRCGMFSGSGCWLPIVVRPPSPALPALERA